MIRLLHEYLFTFSAIITSVFGVGAVGAFALERKLDEASIMVLCTAVCAIITFGFYQSLP